MTPRRSEIRQLLGSLSAASSGSFRPSDAEVAGLTRHERTALVASGELTAVHYGVYTLADSQEIADRARAAGLVLPPGAAIGRRTAAELLGVDPRTPQQRGRQLDVECLVPRGLTPIRRPGIRSFASDLPPEDVTSIVRTPVTTPARTAADLLRWLPPFMALAVADAMAGRKLISIDDVEPILDRWEGHRHIAQARRLLALMDPRTESYGESWLRLRLVEAGFPVPEVQIPVLDAHGREVYRIDMGYPQLRLGLEYDGEEFHDELGPDDQIRRADLRTGYGWNVLGFRKNLVLGPSLLLEWGVGDLLGLEPAIRYRTW